MAVCSSRYSWADRLIELGEILQISQIGTGQVSLSGLSSGESHSASNRVGHAVEVRSSLSRREETEQDKLVD